MMNQDNPALIIQMGEYENTLCMMQQKEHQSRTWDYLILTASNKHQAEVYRSQLSFRTFDPKTHVAVIPDNEGKRIGSGGATLSVIKYIQDREASLGHFGFDGLRILVIHSGGDSKRTPQYSAIGKLFSPVPRILPDGRPSTLFDEFMISLVKVASQITEGMLLVSGDVLLLFNPEQVTFAGKGAAAISFKEKAEIGKNHGVYLRGSCGNVAKCLQKQPMDVLLSMGAVDEFGMVDIDTGVLIFSPDILLSLAKMIEGHEKDFINERVRLSLYADFLYPLGSDSTLDLFYQEKPEGEYSQQLKECRKAIWDTLHSYRLKLLQLKPARFVHFGTTHEVAKLMNTGIDEFSYLGWEYVVHSSVPEGISAYQSIMTSDSSFGETVHLELSYVHNASMLGNNVMLSCVELDGQKIPDDVVLHGLKLQDGSYVVRIYGISDNPKEDKLFGRSLNELGIECSLWDAPLYAVCDSMHEAVKAALDLYEIVIHGADDQAWRKSERKSLCAGFNESDPKAISSWSCYIDEIISMEQLTKDILAKVPVSCIQSKIDPRGLTESQKQWLDERLSSADYGEAMRLHYYLGKILNGKEGEVETSKAFNQISEATVSQISLEVNTCCRIIKEKQTVSLPLRVNWGGGWSDTPPYCLENGGTVLNAAILLNGKEPVVVNLERLKEKKIVFVSMDTEQRAEYTDIRELQIVGDPFDSFALHKASLLAAGILPSKGGTLESILERLGGGFSMTTVVSGVPKGSGLGTSSILGGACIKALFEFFDIQYKETDLYSHVLVMEQIMSTGGGWQDQVGGLTTGIKMTTSQPGLVQRLSVEHVTVPPEAWNELKERFVLIYTGQHRLARNLLRDVVGRYVGNETESIYALNEIRCIAIKMRRALEQGNIDAFATLLSEHWSLSKMIDKGSTNELIDQIFDALNDMIDGKLVCGAGGGGFLQAILKKGVYKEQIQQRLANMFPNTGVELYNATLV